MPSERSAELVVVNPGVAQNTGERSAFEFTMKRDDQRNRARVVFEPHMATALANSQPTTNASTAPASPPTTTSPDRSEGTADDLSTGHDPDLAKALNLLTP